MDATFVKFLDFAKGKLYKSKIIIISRINEKISEFDNTELTDFKESKEYVKLLLTNRYQNVSLSDSNIHKICTSVKGHPLAIELTLNLCKSMSPKRVIGKLTQHKKGIDELSQRLFEEILEQESTSPEEKDFLYQFSIFKGKVSDQEVEDFFGAACFSETIPSLTDKYLIEYKSEHYDTHPLIREFCYQKLGDKKELHAKAAKLLISQRSDKLNTLLEERVFHHLKGAEEYEKIGLIVEKYGREYFTQAFFEPLQEMIEFLKRKNISAPLFNLLEGDIYNLQGEWAKALLYFEKVMNNSIDEEIAIEGLLKAGNIYEDKGENNKALDIYQKAKTIAEQKDFQKYIAWAYNGIASIKEIFGKYDEAFDLRKKALKISEKLVIKKDTATLLNNIGYIYGQPKFSNYNLEESLYYLNKSLIIQLEISDKSGIATSYNNIGFIYSKKKFKYYSHEKSLNFYKKSLIIQLEIGDKSGIALSCWNIYLAEFRRKNYKTSLFHAFKSYAVYKQLEIKHEIKSVSNEINLTRHQLGKIKFITLATLAIKKLTPELQKEINLDDFLNKTVVIGKKYGRNEVITVQYTDGKTKTGKYKRLKDDIKKGKCQIISAKSIHSPK